MPEFETGEVEASKLPLYQKDMENISVAFAATAKALGEMSAASEAWLAAGVTSLAESCADAAVAVVKACKEEL